MNLQIRCERYSSQGKTLLLRVQMEDLFAMLDGLKPSVLSSYLCGRMKPQVKWTVPLTDVFEEQDKEEGGEL